MADDPRGALVGASCVTGVLPARSARPDAAAASARRSATTEVRPWVSCGYSCEVTGTPRSTARSQLRLARVGRGTRESRTARCPGDGRRWARGPACRGPRRRLPKFVATALACARRRCGGVCSARDVQPPLALSILSREVRPGPEAGGVQRVVRPHAATAPTPREAAWRSASRGRRRAPQPPYRPPSAAAGRRARGQARRGLAGWRCE